MKKRISALLLSIALCLGMLSTAALAASGVQGWVEDGKIVIPVESGAAKDGYFLIKDSEKNSMGFLPGTVVTEDGQEYINIPVDMTEDELLGCYVDTGSGDVVIGQKAAVEYNITIAAAANGTVTTSPAGKAEANETVTITASPANGYKVDSVAVTKDSDGSTVNVTNNQFTMPSEDVTVTVTFVEDTETPVTEHTITLDANGGSCSVASVRTVNGKVPALPTPTRTGYTFNGWYAGSTRVSQGDDAANITVLTARWTANGNQGGNTGSGSSGGGSHGGNVGKPAVVGGNQSSGGNQGGETTGAFSDVQSGAYYADAVQWAVNQGITTGTTSTTFSPNNPCTRAQIVTFLWRANGSPAATGSNPFTDVAQDAYYYDAVLWAVEKGITTGTTATTFSPNNTCTRAQAVTFLHRSAGTPAAGGTNPFTDVGTGAYYTNAVLWAVEKGVTSGTTATTFSPNSTCTRAQIVTFLYRAQ